MNILPETRATIFAAVLSLLLSSHLCLAAASEEDRDSSSSSLVSGRRDGDKSDGDGLLFGFLDAETAALINLLTSLLLLSIVWLVLSPILDGTVSIVRNDKRFYPAINDRLDQLAYANTDYDSVSSATDRSYDDPFASFFSNGGMIDDPDAYVTNFNDYSSNNRDYNGWYGQQQQQGNGYWDNYYNSQTFSKRSSWSPWTNWSSVWIKDFAKTAFDYAIDSVLTKDSDDNSVDEPQPAIERRSSKMTATTTEKGVVDVDASARDHQQEQQPAVVVYGQYSQMERNGI